MSHMNWNYDDELGERNLDVEIEYECEKGYWEHPYTREPHINFYVPGHIEIYSVRVECVEYYNPDGRVITTVKRHDMQEDAALGLDAEALDYLTNEVERNDSFAEELAENAG